MSVLDRQYIPDPNDRVSALIHEVDALEHRRTDAVRTVRQFRGLLVDGLHALENDRPHVTKEFLERSIDAFSKLETRLGISS